MASSAGLQKQRANPQATSQSETHSSTNHLVVCGVVNETDSWLLGDFLGFTSILKEQSVHGIFINCFDLDGYFANSHFNDIGFGRRWEIPDDENWDTGVEILIYTRFDYNHRTRWWEQFTHDEVPSVTSKVLNWITGGAQETRRADVVSIVLIGHGSPAGMYLGDSLLKPVSLTSACSLLHPDIQLNIVMKCCYSGTFMRAFQTSGRYNLYVHISAKKGGKSFSQGRSISGRFRNPHFGASFVRTLGLIQDPEENWSLVKHEKFIKAQWAKPPSQILSTSKMLSSPQKARLMKDVLCRDYVDVSFLQLSALSSCHLY